MHAASMQANPASGTGSDFKAGRTRLFLFCSKNGIWRAESSRLLDALLAEVFVAETLAPVDVAKMKAAE